MFFGDGRHDDDGRLGDRAKQGDLARVVRAHLDHGDVGVVGDGKQRLRNTNEVIEVEVRLQQIEQEETPIRPTPRSTTGVSSTSEKSQDPSRSDTGNRNDICSR